MFDILDEAIGESPASRVRVDDVVATARRRGRLARVATATGAAVAVGLVLQLSVLGAGGPGRGPGSTLGSHSPIGWPTAPRPSTSTGRGTPAPTPVDENRARLGTALEVALRNAQPGIAIAGSDYDDGVVIRHALDPGMNPFDRYDATLELAGSSGTGTLFFQAEPSRPLSSQWSPSTPLARRWLSSCTEFVPPSSDTQRECAAQAGPDGQGIVTVTERSPTGETVQQAFVSWADAQVTVAVSSSAHSPLTLVQLVLIAQNPLLAPR